MFSEMIGLHVTVTEHRAVGLLLLQRTCHRLHGTSNPADTFPNLGHTASSSEHTAPNSEHKVPGPADTPPSPGHTALDSDVPDNPSTVNKVRRPPNNIFLFRKDRCPEIKNANPHLKFHEICEF
jgi:hypothetical protein